MENHTDSPLYCVVEFPDEKEENRMAMAVVSTLWLRNDIDGMKCLWPRYLKTESERIRLVKSHTHLIHEKCEPCPVNIKYKTAIFSKAERRMKDLESMSNVYDDEEGEDDEDRDMVQRNTNKVRVRRPNMKFQNYDMHNNSSSDENNIPSVPSLFPKKKTNDLQDSQVTHVRLSTPHQKNTHPVKCSCDANQALLKQILNKVNELENSLKTVVSNLNSQKINNIEDNVHIDNLPATTKVALENFNEVLNDDKIMSDVCKHFQIIGGKDIVDATRRILSKIMTNELCITYNWSGMNNKNKFSDLKNIQKCIIATVRRNPLFNNATQNDVDNITKAWLRNAGDRDGGRNRRRHRDRE